jgi:hypothetical protein
VPTQKFYFIFNKILKILPFQGKYAHEQHGQFGCIFPLTHQVRTKGKQNPDMELRKRIKPMKLKDVLCFSKGERATTAE